ncbi:hypothetical protein FDU21_14360 [Xanthomonas oryzae pv. oryzae]|nr:hypothetical protein FDU21_14360 [Xanthomonas oryzae pv. oryzae]
MATMSHAAVQCVHVPWRAISLYMLTHPHVPASDESIAGTCVMSCSRHSAAGAAPSLRCMLP